MAESFVDSCKTELIRDRAWRSRAQLELAVVEYISWFNHDRLHESLGDVPPIEFEQAGAATTAEHPGPKLELDALIAATEVRPLRVVSALRFQNKLTDRQHEPTSPLSSNSVRFKAGQVLITGEALRVFADSLGPEDEAAVEATCNTHAIVRTIEPLVALVVVSNPMKTRAIAGAKVKTDKVDAAVLAELLAADFLPSVWVADEAPKRCAGRSRAARSWSGNAPGSRTRCRRSCTAT
jgi:hypothetical protein